MKKKNAHPQNPEMSASNISSNPTTTSNELCIFISYKKSKLVTDSRAVAKAFGKDHKNILKTIASMFSSASISIAEHAQLNFEQSFYKAGNGKNEPMYLMTDDGLMELALGFTGTKAKEIRIQFIKAFRQMARTLQQQKATLRSLCHDWESREIESSTKAKLGSRLMNRRRKEKKDLQCEEALLLSRVQLQLPMEGM